jgi:Kef-type K+ transport system membrane component KefB
MSGRATALLATYAGIIGMGIVTLLAVLAIGRAIAPAPQVPPLVRVGEAGVDCLGSTLAASQSGVFLEFYVPGPAAPNPFGDRVGQGRLDRHLGAIALEGTCATGTAQQTQRFNALITLESSSGQGPGTLVGAGWLTVKGRPIVDLELRSIATRTEGAGAAGSRGDIVPRVFLAVATICLMALLVGQVFRRVGQPSVMGEILAGIVLGPDILGALHPGITGYLFPADVIEVLQVLAQFGLVLFMFLVGLKLDLSTVRGSGHQAVLISHVSIALPFAFGVAAALVLYPLLGNGSFEGFALFMGAAMAITAFPVLARIVNDTGLSRHRIGVLSLTCAAVDDVTAWSLLAVVTAVVRSERLLQALATVVLSAGFAAVMILGVRPILARLLHGRDMHTGTHQPLLGGLLASLFLAAWATETIGSHPIFGAFLMGMVMPRSPQLTSALVSKLEGVTTRFLLPIFFAIAGLETRVALGVQPMLWWGLAALVLVTAVVGKWGSSTIAARALGLSWRDSNALGILMNTRGLTELVILGIGRSLGVLSAAMFTMMVLMALATTLMATPLLRATYRHAPPAPTSGLGTAMAVPPRGQHLTRRLAPPRST